MTFKCKIGLHSWNGCKCSECEKNRDEQHSWNGCKCSNCGKNRDEQHDWNNDCEKCSKCGKSRQNTHIWKACSCANCKVTNHKWIAGIECACANCGKQQNHKWDYNFEQCINCSKRSGISKRIIEFEIVNLFEELFRPNYDQWSTSIQHFECAERTSLLIRRKYNFKIEPQQVYEITLYVFDEYIRILKEDILLRNDEKAQFLRSLNSTKSESNKFLKLKSNKFFENLRENAVYDLEVIKESNSDATNMLYFEQPRPVGNALCSLDNCPCHGPDSIIPEGQGYLFIEASNVNFRKDCLSYDEFQIKLEKMISQLPQGTNLMFSDVPVLVCNQGIKQLEIDPIIAQEDAKLWWNTGLIPLRPSPKRKY